MTDLPVTIPDIQSLTGLTVFVYLITAAVHSAQLLPSRRFLPLLSMGLGTVISMAASLSSAMALGDAAVLGVVAGALAPGLEETRKGFATGTAKAADALNARRALTGRSDD